MCTKIQVMVYVIEYRSWCMCNRILVMVYEIQVIQVVVYM